MVWFKLLLIITLLILFALITCIYVSNGNAYILEVLNTKPSTVQVSNCNETNNQSDEPEIGSPAWVRMIQDKYQGVPSYFTEEY